VEENRKEKYVLEILNFNLLFERRNKKELRKKSYFYETHRQTISPRNGMKWEDISLSFFMFS